MARKPSDTYKLLLRVLHAREQRVQTELARHRQQLTARQEDEREAETLIKAYDVGRFRGQVVSASTLRTNQRFQERVEVLRSLREGERQKAEKTLEHTLRRWQALHVSKEMMLKAHDRAERQEYRSQAQKLRRSAQSRHRRGAQAWSMLNGSDD